MSNNKRTFFDIRRLILLCLADRPKTINLLAKETGINWRTVNNHLIYLLGISYVKEIISTPYARIFSVTNSGLISLYFHEEDGVRMPPRNA